MVCCLFTVSCTYRSLKYRRRDIVALDMGNIRPFFLNRSDHSSIWAWMIGLTFSTNSIYCWLGRILARTILMAVNPSSRVINPFLACSCFSHSRAGFRTATAIWLFFLLGNLPVRMKRMVVLPAPIFFSFHGGMGMPKYV